MAAPPSSSSTSPLLTASRNEAAHDALSDVQATIALARLIKTKQPRLWDFCPQAAQEGCRTRRNRARQPQALLPHLRHVQPRARLHRRRLAARAAPHQQETRSSSGIWPKTRANSLRSMPKPSATACSSKRKTCPKALPACRSRPFTSTNPRSSSATSKHSAPPWQKNGGLI